MKCFDSSNQNFSMDCDGNLVCNSITTKVQSSSNNLNIDLIYPIGSYYETSDDNFNPNFVWGGTWELSPGGLVTVSQDLNQSEFDTIGKIGGSKYLQAHYHDIRYYSPTGEGVSISYTHEGLRSLTIDSWGWVNNIANEFNSSSNLATNMIGKGNGENLQPYIVVKRWHRIG